MDASRDTEARRAYEQDVAQRTNAGETVDGRTFDDLDDTEKHTWRDRANEQAGRPGS